MSRSVVTDTLIGRQQQLDQLRGWVGELAAGTGRSVIIEGEAGIGKSALMRSVTTQARAIGVQVYWGACEELSGAFPLLPLLEALGVRDRDADPERAAVVRTLRSGWAPGATADRVAEAVEQLLSLFDEVCGCGPVLLVVDDLQWADEATVLTWSRLAHAVRQLPLLLVGTTRPVPQRDDVSALRRLAGTDGVLHLEGLGPTEIQQLTTTLVGGRPGPRLLRLAEGASGNPLYLTELVDALVRGRRLVERGGTIEVTAGPAPASLAAAIADRLAFLPAPARGLVRAAALLGLDFSVTELTVVSGMTLTGLLPALDEAVAAGVLRVDGATVSFRHALIRAALYEGIPAIVRAAWHRDVGRALADHGAAVEGVARQLLPALDGADPAPWSADHWIVGWLVEIGPQLVGQVPQAAIPLLRWALAGTPVGTTAHGVLSCRLADVLYRVGDAAGGAQVATRALAQVTDPDLLVDLHWTLTQCRAITGASEQALRDLAQALETDLAPSHKARLLVLIARVLRTLGRIDEAEGYAARALAAATAVGDRWGTAWALSVQTMVHGIRGEIDAALPLLDRALAVAEAEPALADLRLLLQINQANAYGEIDRCEEAIDAARQVRQLADKAGNIMRVSQAESLLGELLFAVGRWDEARSEVDHVDQGPGSSRNPVIECYRHGIAASITLHCGGDAARHFAAARPHTEQLGHRAIYTLALARSLDRERADDPDAALAELLGALDDSAEEPAETAALLADAVRLAVLAGERTRARGATERAVALAAGSGTHYRRATAAHCRGLLESDPQLLRHAAGCYEAAGRPLPRAQALEAAAGLCADAGDLATARTSFNDAFALYAMLGAAWDLARTQARFRSYGIRRGPLAKHRRVDQGWESLTPSEEKIVALVAQGMSNPQIAAELFLSRRTVQSHVSHILSKLKLHSRMDIAREAALRGNLT